MLTLNSIMCWLKIKPGQNQEYQPPSYQDSESSCFWHCLQNLLWRTSIHKIKDYLTNEVRVVSIEGNDEAEKVADWHNQLKELIEGQNLQQIEAENIFVPYTINSSPASSNAPSFFFL